MKTCEKNLSLLHALIAGLGLILASRVSAQTARIFTTLHSFSQGNQGANPDGGVVLSGNTLYGKTDSGGSSGDGVIFALGTDGSGYTNIYDFTTIVSSGGGAFFTESGLILSGNTLYGTTDIGGSGANGTVFSINTNGTGYTILHSFPPFYDNSNLVYNLYGTNTDGYGPVAALVLSGNTLYGTTRYGGDYGNGTVFAVHTDGTGFTVLHHFSAFVQPLTTNSDGAMPRAGLILSANILYGTASFSGVNGGGTVFAVNTNGTDFRVLHSFFSGDGIAPIAGLVLSGNTLYGTTLEGGTFRSGTVFAVNTDGTGFTVLHHFDGSSGVSPGAGLTLAGSTLFGTTLAGGGLGNGTVFSINTNGADFTILHNFTPAPPPNLTNYDGTSPASALVLSGYTLYGTTAGGGSAGKGVAFSLGMWPTVQFTAHPTNALAPPLSVQFDTAGTDSFGNSLTNWNWDFGDGSKSTSQNPSHTYSSLGTFSPVLVATNSLGNPVSGVGPVITVAPAGIQNGGFETGDFTGWTLSGDTNDTFVDDGTLTTIPPESGSYEAALGTTTGSFGYLFTSSVTTPGTGYLISFWFANPFPVPATFLVSWNGNLLMGLTNPPAIGWTNFQFAVQASGSSSVLQFEYLNEVSLFALDNVSVVAVPASAPPQLTIVRSGANVVLTWPTNAVGFILQSTTNLAPPAAWNTNLPAPTVVNGQNTVTNPISGPRKLYRLIQ